MKKIIYLLTVVILLSSCSGVLYNHYPKVKRDKQHASVPKQVPEKKETPNPGLIPLKTQEPVEVNNGIAYAQKPLPQRPQEQTTNLKHKKQVAANASPQQDTVAVHKNLAPPPVVNGKASISLILSLLAWGLGIGALSFVGLGFGILAVAFLFAIISLIMGILAIREINKYKGAYKGEGLAAVGIILSLIFLSVGALIIGITLLLILLIG